MQITMLGVDRVKAKAKGYDAKLHQWVKALPARCRAWLPDEKAWAFDVTYLQDFTNKFPNVVLPEQVNPVKLAQAPVTTDFVVPRLKLAPFPFQNVGIEFVVNNGGRAIIGDDRGLGKTIQGIGVAAFYISERPVVIVCPKSMNMVWQEHIEQWLDGDVSCHIITGQKVYAYPKAAFYIISWGLLAHHIDFLSGVAKISIFDESHRACNPRSGQSKASSRLSHAANICVPLTGTPMRNGPKDIWNLLNMVAPKQWPDFFPFAKAFCNAHQKEVYTSNGRKMVWDFDGASNQAELALKLRGHMIRRLKEEVLPDLPEKYPPRLINFTLPPKSFKQYIDVLHETTEAIREAMRENGYLRGEALVQLTTLRKLAADLVLDQIGDWIEDFIEDDKLIVFTHHRDTADKLFERFKTVAVKVVGGLSQAERKAAMDAFKDNPKKTLFIGNIDAAGEGLTLVSSCTVLFAELPWTPAQYNQCSDRAHRIGQNRAVSILVAMPLGTIYRHIWEILLKKGEVIDGIVDMKSVMSAFADRLLEDDKQHAEKQSVKDGLSRNGRSDTRPVGRPDLVRSGLVGVVPV